MEWQRIETKPKPKQKQDCIVLTKDGTVFRAISHRGWNGGFCNGDGTNGFGIPDVTHWTPFVEPSNAEISGPAQEKP